VKLKARLLLRTGTEAAGLLSTQPRRKQLKIVSPVSVLPKHFQNQGGGVGLAFDGVN